jgi:hypothetical protein
VPTANIFRLSTQLLVQIGGDYAEATKMLSEAVGTFVNFISDRLQGAAANSITSEDRAFWPQPP